MVAYGRQLANVIPTLGGRTVMSWFLDCFCYSACLGSEFPVNSYEDEDPEKLARIASQLLARSVNSGVDEVRISRASLGQNPKPISEADVEVVDIRHHDEEYVEGLM